MALGLQAPGQHQAKQLDRAQGRWRAVMSAPPRPEAFEAEVRKRLDLFHQRVSHRAMIR